MKNDIRIRLKELLMHHRATVNSISNSTTEQRRLNRQINENATITSETISSIIEAFPEIDANWLITGKGEMYKSTVAGRDNLGTGNKVSGENSGVIGNTGTIGNVGVKNMSIGEPGLIKKIIDKDGLSLEFSESVEILHRTNASMEIRIKDLETINALQAKTIETMQMLIDTLTKK